MQAQEQLDFNTNHFTKDHVREFERFNKFDKAKAAEHFDNAAANYEGVYLRAGYPDPWKCAEFVDEFCHKLGVGKDAEILDMACGTGLVGQALGEKGFKNIYGCDISEKMLEIAQEKDVYKSLDQFELGQEDFIGTFPIPYKQRFDFVTCAGFLNNNQVDQEVFEQMLLGLKNGGMMIFAARYSYIGDYWYTDKLEQLEKLGRLKAVKSDTFFKYDQLPECFGKFTKTPVKVFAYQKTEEDSVLAYSRVQTMKKDSGMSVSTQDSQ